MGSDYRRPCYRSKACHDHPVFRESEDHSVIGEVLMWCHTVRDLLTAPLDAANSFAVCLALPSTIALRNSFTVSNCRVRDSLGATIEMTVQILTSGRYPLSCGQKSFLHDKRSISFELGAKIVSRCDHCRKTDIPSLAMSLSADPFRPRHSSAHQPPVLWAFFDRTRNHPFHCSPSVHKFIRSISFERTLGLW